MHQKESLQEQNGVGVTVDAQRDKIEYSDKNRGGYQSEKYDNGSMSEKAREGYTTHESDDTVVSTPTEAPVNTEEKPDDDQEEEPLSGIKVMLVLTAVGGVCFILLLDLSIIATVSLPSRALLCLNLTI